MKKEEHTYKPEFKYTHDNPYHDKLSEFADFVLRDEEAEKNPGGWNKNIFKRVAPLCIEIGSGYGDFMAEYCTKYAEDNFVGMDYRFKRSFGVAKKLSKLPFQNFKFLRAKGERIEFMFASGEVDKVFYFFPDPWPKKRHHKKRLFQEPFLAACHKTLKSQGELLIKTDNDQYFAWMLEHFETYNETHKHFTVELKSFDLKADFPEHFLSSFETKFEKIFLNQGIKIKALVLKNV